ncbi:RING zinc finger protein, putative [Plasmodium ovale curtisi]|uniref:RING zinc finger protein, putative n=1 Tax=Plasmodium ovale curtisi TaxID=864141 RepID=A0A1A8VWU5_PLAOA|nr:RING zinc finger protein, putative [Plasmodium ovale curtisi]SBT00737.1 RING zinc finger protein, putative [Plasmodium ovale curtisi]
MVEEENTLRGYFRRIYVNTSDYVKNYMTASDQEMQNNADPIMDIIATAPSDSLYFIERINLISAIISMSTSFPYLIYLIVYWNDCSCNEILRWWIVINSILQLIQAPVRFFLLRRLTSSKGWKLSKRFSLLNYLWFITDRKLKNESCSICLSDFVEKDEIMELRCLHNFHTKCAKKWLSQRRLCPLCQRDVMKDD